MPNAGQIKDGEHILPVRVYYEDTDAGGIVYYANYLRFLERGRSDMLRLLGVDQVRMLDFREPDDIMFVVRRAEVDYLRPARLDDALTVHTKLAKLGAVSLTMTQEIRRQTEGQEEPLVRAVIKAGILGQDGKPKRLSGRIRTMLEMADRLGTEQDSGRTTGI